MPARPSSARHRETIEAIALAPGAIAVALRGTPQVMLLRFGTAVGLTGAAVLLKLGLGSAFIQSPFLLFFGAVMLSARAGGLGSGLLTCVLAAAAIYYFFLPPALSLAIADPSRLAELALFVLEALLVVWLTASLHSERQHGEARICAALEALRHEREALATAAAAPWDRVGYLKTMLPGQPFAPGAVDGPRVGTGLRYHRAALPGGLTPRELQVLMLLAGSRTNRQIAAELTLSLNTVERHIANLYRKLGTRSRVGATTSALRLGLISVAGL